jgi:DNA-binding transcriptional MerR regulator
MSDHGHLSIGEVLGLLQAEFPDVTISKIRFLESQGLLDPERTPSGYRKFYEGDIDRLRWILAQQRENFLPLKVIKERLEARDNARQTAPATAEHQMASAGDATPGPMVAPSRQPVPIWMADVTRSHSNGEGDTPAGPTTVTAPGAPTTSAPRRITPPAASAPEAHGTRQPVPTNDAGRTGPGRVPTPLDTAPTSVSLSIDELSSASGLTRDQLHELEEYGLLAGHRVGSDTYYDGDALMIAQKSGSFLRHGIEPRHLRMFKVAAEREAGFLEQVVMPMLKQRNPAARQQAVELLAELAGLGQSLRAALLRHALRDHLSPPP